MFIVFKGLCKSYNGKNVFKNISGKINPGDKIGLIGVNGVGKTTLVKILAGIEETDEGSISYGNEKESIGYLSQYCEFNGDTTVYEEIYNSGIKRSNFNESNYQFKVKRFLNKAGFAEEDFNQKAYNLSGGQKTKLSICKVIACNPYILFFDEPTNHLDVDTIKWLEDFIRKINITVIIISHDRQFLDNTVKKIFLLNHDCLKEYKGNYSQYKIQSDNEFKSMKMAYKKQQTEVRHIKKIIYFQKSWFEKAHNAAGQNDFLRSKADKHISVMRAKQKQLERIENSKIQEPKNDIAAAFNVINMREKSKNKLPKYIIEVNGLSKSYGEKVIFKNVSFNIKNNDKVALIGANGSGKTTLLKILVNEESKTDGTVYINPSLKISYFSQELEHLNFENTVLEEVLISGVKSSDVRLMLGCLLFKCDDVYKKIKVLSMGEKCRVAFAKLILSGADMLIMDEPTNYMDIVSREKIEEVLEEYQGTVFLASHDRYFIKKIANRIFEIKDKKINVFEGNYNYYLESKLNIKKKNKLGNVSDEITKLECEVSFISGKLDNEKLSSEEKENLGKQFIETVRKINGYKKYLRDKRGVR